MKNCSKWYQLSSHYFHDRSGIGKPAIWLLRSWGVWNLKINKMKICQLWEKIANNFRTKLWWYTWCIRRIPVLFCTYVVKKNHKFSFDVQFKFLRAIKFFKMSQMFALLFAIYYYKIKNWLLTCVLEIQIFSFKAFYIKQKQSKYATF